MSQRHRWQHGAHEWHHAHVAAVPHPGNTAYVPDTRNYEGKHKGGCLTIAVLPFVAGLLSLAVVLLVLYRTFRY